MPSTLPRRRALVMGGSKGLGRAIAEAFVDDGIDVAICARGAEALERTAAETGTAGFVADLSAPDGAKLLMRDVQARFGPPDILVVNTGGPRPAHFDSIDDDAWRLGFESLWMSAIQSIREALPHMRSQSWGRVMVITSTAAKEPIPGLLMSSAFRSGIHGLVNALSREVAADGVTVNAMMPGYTLTDRLIQTGLNNDAVIAAIPARRLGQPEEFAALARFLASDLAGYITGQAIACDGGVLGSI